MSNHADMNGDKLERIETSQSGLGLDRQITMQLSSDQYERLFFQPTGAKGDLAKRLGNPTLLGVLGFLIPYTSTIFCLLQFKGSDSTSTVSVSGSYYFLGGIAMNIAGICEFILGNTFPFVVFIIYGCHWVNLGYTGDPAHALVAAYGVDGATSKAYNSGQGHYAVVMALVSFIFLLGSLRTNVPFVLVFFTLVFLFAFIAAANYQVGYNPTPEGLSYAAKLLRVGGGFGFVASIMGWYLAIITVCASTGVPCPLPIFDLSQKVFAHNKAAKGEHAGVVRKSDIAA